MLPRNVCSVLSHATALGGGEVIAPLPNASKQLSVPPSSRTIETFAKFTSVLLVTLLLTQVGTLGDGLNQLKRANFYLHIFIKSNFRGTLRVKLLTPTSRTKCLLHHVEREILKRVTCRGSARKGISRSVCRSVLRYKV